MKKTFLPWIAAAVLALAALACLPTPEPPTATPAPTNTPAPTSAPEPSGDVAHLNITNASSFVVCYVYISPTKSTDWGPDQLGEANVIQPEASFTINNIPVGIYDLQATDCDGNTLSLLYEADLTAGGDFTWTVEAVTVSLTIVNESTSIGCRVYLVPPSWDNWGSNVAPEGTQIQPNTTFTLTGIPPAVYAVRIETCTANYFWEWAEIDLTVDNTVTMGN